MSATLAPRPGPLATTPPIPSGIPTCDISDPNTFRSHFPEFADTSNYPDTAVQFFLDLGGVMCSPYMWCNMRQAGVELVCAHFLALQQLAMQGGSAGGVPGMATGPVTSKSVSKVSVGRDVNITSFQGAGPWNYTMYGQQYYWLLQLVGTGGYETLAVGVDLGMVGIVNTWARGVMLQWGS